MSNMPTGVYRAGIGGSFYTVYHNPNGEWFWMFRSNAWYLQNRFGPFETETKAMADAELTT